MGIFKVDLYAINPLDENKRTPAFTALVDTGSHMTWLPRRALLDAGINPRGKKNFRNSNNQLCTRDYGYAILSADKYTTNGEVVFGEKSDQILLGVHTIEGFGVKVDNINGCFEPVERFFTGISLAHEGEEF